ncbi:PQQ-binding-like beta-propeller repeat protein [bacterium]|nr:PQQ-binding-like beta-propeller repeat protein [bacterium]
MRFLWILAVVAALTMGTYASRASEDWPQFRGPTGEGHAASTKLPLSWSSTQNVVWREEVPGVGWSSPIVYRGVVYLTTAMLNNAGNPKSLRLLAYDTASGNLIWNREVLAVSKPPPKHAKNSHASPTPIAEGEHIYVHFGHLGTACVDLSGNVLWRQTSLGYAPVHGNGGSPALVDNKLIFSCDGASDPFVVALNKNNGEVIWRVPRVTTAQKTFSFSTPLLISVDGQRELITPGSGVVNALNPEDGSSIWSARYGEGYSVIPRPVFGQGMIFIGTGYDRPWVYAIKADGRGDVTDSHVAWTTFRGAPNTPSLLLIGDELYFVSDSGVASCVDSRSGKLHWNERLGGDFSASPIDANGRIYFTNERGKTFVVKASTQYEKLAENDLGEHTLASLAASGPSLFIRTEEHLYRIQEPTR